MNSEGYIIPSKEKDVESLAEKADKAEKAATTNDKNSMLYLSYEMIKIFIAEFIATALLLFLGCSSCLDWGHGTHSFLISISFGLAVALIIQSFGHISGAHLNPAVTIAAVLLKIVSAPLAIIYVTAQIVGATAGYAALQYLTPARIWAQNANQTGVCLTSLNSELHPVHGLILEFIATSILILLCCACWDPCNKRWQDGVSLKFGFAVTLLSFTIGPFTGCSMNPARTFGPAFVSNNFDSHWIYWVGPISAAIIVTLLYKAFFWPKKNQKKNSSFSLSCQ